ncbi:hypothetical protein [Sporisorium scitamineum]|nr:hypothetical protein [Sporisorium scitamineum]
MSSAASSNSSARTSTANLAGSEWVAQLACAGQNPVASMTHAEFLSFVGGHLAAAETEKQGLCPSCVERAPTDDIEQVLAGLGWKETLKASNRQGLACQHLQSGDLMKEALLLYHRNRQVPFMAMSLQQLKKICTHVTTSADWTVGTKVNLDSTDHWDLIQWLTSFYGSACAPNVNADYKWTANQTTSRYEAIRAALRAGVEVSDLLDARPTIKSSVAKKLNERIADAISKPSWLPTSIPPISTQSLGDLSEPTGEITGITPLSLRCHSLDAQHQGLYGIGRLGLLYSGTAFRSRSDQFVHITEHAELLNRGLKFCFLCSSWFTVKEDSDHVQRCRELHFSKRSRPLTFDDFKLFYRLPNATCICEVTSYIPVDAEGKLEKLKDRFQSHIYLLTAKSVPNPGPNGPKRSKLRLIRSESQTCVVPYCNHSTQGLTSMLVHLAQYHQLPVLQRSGEYVYDGFQADEEVHEYASKQGADSLLRLGSSHSSLID